MKSLIILNDPPYVTERCYNGLRMAHALLKNDAQGEVTVFLMADSVLCAKAGQKTPEGFYNVERMLKRVTTGRGSVLLCGTCMDARGNHRSRTRCRHPPQHNGRTGRGDHRGRQSARILDGAQTVGPPNDRQGRVCGRYDSQNARWSIAEMNQRGPFEASLAAKEYDEESVFAPEHLLREARRQKGLRESPVPDVCVLDPDGDIVRRLKEAGRAVRDPFWACYHTDLYTFEHEGSRYGVIGCAVGAPFAVLVAEELFASGCAFLISMTSAGRIAKTREPPYFVAIDRALRDEGTSFHYVPPALWSAADEALVAAVHGELAGFRVPVDRGASWTTDAPFRETATAIERARDLGVLAVEMEAAALYAFARARKRSVLCFAHVTNTMGTVKIDFEKGASDGVYDALCVVASARRTWELRGNKRPSVKVPGG